MRYASLLLLCVIALSSRATPKKGSELDTLNQTDSDGLRQGHWIIYGQDKGLNEYKEGQKVEEGLYVDNRKDGIWTKYFASGVIQNEITYSNSRPNGPAKIYYSNGKIKEEGIWMGNKWKGKYMLYYLNGRPKFQWMEDTYISYSEATYGKILEHYRVLRNENGKVSAKILLNLEGQEVDTLFIEAFRAGASVSKNIALQDRSSVPRYFNEEERQWFLSVGKLD